MRTRQLWWKWVVIECEGHAGRDLSDKVKPKQHKTTTLTTHWLTRERTFPPPCARKTSATPFSSGRGKRESGLSGSIWRHFVSSLEARRDRLAWQRKRKVNGWVLRVIIKTTTKTFVWIKSNRMELIGRSQKMCCCLVKCEGINGSCQFVYCIAGLSRADEDRKLIPRECKFAEQEGRGENQNKHTTRIEYQKHYSSPDLDS